LHHEISNALIRADAPGALSDQSNDRQALVPENFSPAGHLPLGPTRSNELEANPTAMKTLLPQTKLTSEDMSASALACVARRAKRLHMTSPALPPRPVFAGNPRFLRALRAAEMAVWNATGGDYFRSPAAN
jgi:hypothetical protein